MGYKEARAAIAPVVNFQLEDDAEVLEGVEGSEPRRGRRKSGGAEA